MSLNAFHRREILLSKQRRAQESANKKLSQRRNNRFRTGLKSLSSAFQKINPGQWIEQLEKDQELADKLEEMNREMEEEQRRKQICNEARRACYDAVRDHLRSYLDENPNGSYEGWIRELHPENSRQENKEEEDVIDHRFYAEGSDHRILWNEHLLYNRDLGDGVVREHVPTSIMQKIEEQGIQK
mmetsp:Transcript_40519/g.49330  ORF Transcript_40519/g.49330 Transcript_40519/m.49330 type:complete len:185 (+) Transcript_40519:2-556(+)